MGRLWDFRGGVHTEVWERAPTVPGRSAKRWRLDAHGWPVLRPLRVQGGGLFAYQLDHIIAPKTPQEKSDPWFRSAANAQLLGVKANQGKGNRKLTRSEIEQYQHHIKPTGHMMDTAEIYGYGNVVDEKENVLWKSHTKQDVKQGIAKLKVPQFTFPPCVCPQSDISPALANFLKKMESYADETANDQSGLSTQRLDDDSSEESEDNEASASRESSLSENACRHEHATQEGAGGITIGGRLIPLSRKNESLSALLKDWEACRTETEVELLKLVMNNNRGRSSEGKDVGQGIQLSTPQADEEEDRQGVQAHHHGVETQMPCDDLPADKAQAAVEAHMLNEALADKVATASPSSSAPPQADDAGD